MSLSSRYCPMKTDEPVTRAEYNAALRQRNQASSETRRVRNDRAQCGAYPDALREIISLTEHRHTRAVVEQWPDYQPTTLHSLDSVARDLGLGAVWLKDE